MQLLKPSVTSFVLVVALHVGLIALALRAAPETMQLGNQLPTIQGVIVQAPQTVTPPPEPPKEIPKPKPKPKPKPEPKPVPKPPVAPPSERAVKVPEPEPETIEEVQEEEESQEVVEEALPQVAPDSVLSDKVVQPRADAGHLHNRTPSYPNLSRRLREEGIVLLEILIRADGTVGEIKLKESSGFKRLDDAALKAIASWRFQPATQNGQPIDFWYEQPLEFNLH